jgi:hypothetical protein
VVPQIRKQLKDAKEQIQNFPKEYEAAARPVVLLRAKEIIAVIQGSQGAPFALSRALRDAAKLLSELDASTLKASPSQVELATSNAALAALAQPKVVLPDKAEV